MKVSANELRIGNYHKTAGLEIPRLDISSIKIDGQAFAAITAYGIYLVNNGVIDFEPIPITEEWLLKLYFSLEVNHSYSSGKHGNFNVYRKDGFVHNTSQKQWWFGNALKHQPTCVHQLQNLYFALTGEELTIKP